jgi:hypothetical protein
MMADSTLDSEIQHLQEMLAQAQAKKAQAEKVQSKTSQVIFTA